MERLVGDSAWFKDKRCLAVEAENDLDSVSLGAFL